MQALKMHKEYLIDFWSRQGGMKRRKLYSEQQKENVIRDLKIMSELRLMYRSSHTRKKFDNVKNKRGKFTGFVYCFACRNKAEVRHHIILLSRGGRNQKNNIVALCRDCHAQIHPWLCG